MTSARGNHWPAVAVLAAQVLRHPGSVVRVEVRHDDGCAIFRDGSCDCDPEVVASAVRPEVVLHGR